MRLANLAKKVTLKTSALTAKHKFRESQVKMILLYGEQQGMY